MIDFEELLRAQRVAVPDIFYKTKTLHSFLDLHAHILLQLLQDPQQFKRWVGKPQNWLRIYKGFLRSKPELALKFLQLGMVADVSSDQFQKVLVEHFRILKNSSSEQFKLCSWSLDHINSISDRRLQNQFEYLLRADFFCYQWHQIEKLMTLLNMTRLNIWKGIHKEYQTSESGKVQVDDLIWILPKIYLIEREVDKTELLLQFLVHYHHFPSGWSRKYPSWKKNYPEIIGLWERTIHASIDNLPWDVILAADSNEKARTYLERLIFIARGRFLIELILALVLTVGLTLWIDPQNLMFWLILSTGLNLMEWYFATSQPNIIYYCYKFKFRLIKENLNFDVMLRIWMLNNLERLKVTQWQRSLLNLIKNDPWQFYPPLKKDVVV